MSLRMTKRDYERISKRADHFDAKQQAHSEGSEHDEQAALFRWAEANLDRLPELCKLYAIPNGGQRNVIVAMRLKAEGVKSGVWDIHLPICRNDYIGLWIEMKYGKNTLSDNQKLWGQWMTEEGHATAVCYSWQAAAQEIVRYLGKEPADYGVPL